MNELFKKLLSFDIFQFTLWAVILPAEFVCVTRTVVLRHSRFEYF